MVSWGFVIVAFPWYIHLYFYVILSNENQANVIE